MRSNYSSNFYDCCSNIGVTTRNQFLTNIFIWSINCYDSSLSYLLKKYNHLKNLDKSDFWHKKLNELGSNYS